MRAKLILWSLLVALTFLIAALVLLYQTGPPAQASQKAEAELVRPSVQLIDSCYKLDASTEIQEPWRVYLYRIRNQYFVVTGTGQILEVK